MLHTGERSSIRTAAAHALRTFRSATALVALLCLCITLTNCSRHLQTDDSAITRPALIHAVDLTSPANPIAIESPVSLSSARNESLDLVVQLDAAVIAKHGWLRINPARSNRRDVRIAVAAYQVLPVTVDLNHASYVRQTGRPAQTQEIPRVLLPLPMRDGLVDLSNVRDPEHPSEPASKPRSKPALLWFEMHIPAEAAGGDYQTACELLDKPSGPIVDALPLFIAVHDFILPDTPHLQMAAQIDWTALVRLYPFSFETITPRLLNRREDRYTGAVRTLDQLMDLAHANRAEVVVPRLQPTVKWPPGGAPQIDWSDFDSLLSPWMKGDGFTDRAGLGYWPLPSPDFLDHFDPRSRAQYWNLAASHFDQLDWLDRSPVVLRNESPGRANTADSIILSAQAATVLSAHPRVRVTVPLEDDQVELSSPANQHLIEPADAARLLTASPGLVFASPIQQWSKDVPPPKHWLRTDLPGLVPYAGAGSDEHDVRTWAWLAFVRDASLVLWDSPLPAASSLAQASDPRELVWFYPGQWFGVDQPLPTIQLKWLRRAQQDFEYLYLARERGESENALRTARLLTKPVELQPMQEADPLYAMLSGTTDTRAWNEARELIAQRIMQHVPGQPIDPHQEPIDLRMMRWLAPQQKPTVLAREVKWMWDTGPAAPAGNWLLARVGIDIYNPSDQSTDTNQMQWTTVTTGWQVRPQPIEVAALPRFRVRHVKAEARFNLDQAAATSRQRPPLEAAFVDGFTGLTIPCRFVLPVAISERRERPLNLDGSLDEWDPADAIQLDQPLVRMLNRPAMQQQSLELADAPTSLFSNWSEEALYLSYRLNDVTTSDVRATHNFVDYESRRAWGEDLCEVLIQPLYVDNSTGPTLHIVCKPGGIWVERKLDARQNADPWQPFEGASIRYASTMDSAKKIWRGEIAIPWKAMTNSDHGRPTLLRFNFIQHEAATGQSASWAGPVDFGRDDSFMGVIQLKEPNTPGFAKSPQ